MLYVSEVNGEAIVIRDTESDGKYDLTKTELQLAWEKTKGTDNDEVDTLIKGHIRGVILPTEYPRSDLKVFVPTFTDENTVATEEEYKCLIPVINEAYEKLGLCHKVVSVLQECAEYRSYEYDMPDASVSFAREDGEFDFYVCLTDYNNGEVTACLSGEVDDYIFSDCETRFTGATRSEVFRQIAELISSANSDLNLVR